MSDLPSSKLGTKEHWDAVYAREVKTFKDIGDEGEVWFGEESAEEMVEWVIDHFGVSTSANATSPTILDVGCGNAHLLMLLAEAGYPTSLLTGIDYSEASIQLCEDICKHHELEGITFKAFDVINESMQGQTWDLVTDKGTFDAIALCPEEEGKPHPSSLFPARIAALLKPGSGIFLITSCNFTEEELRARFATAETGLSYMDNIPRQSFEFGGSKGQTIVTVAFQKR